MSERSSDELNILMLAKEAATLSTARTSVGRLAVTGLVVMVRIPGERDLVLHDYPIDGTEAVVATRWPADRALRFRGLFARLFASPEGPGETDCYGLVEEVMDWAPNTAQDANTRPVHPRRLVAGEPYGVRQGAELTHAMMGLSTPDLSLAIGGKQREGKAGGGRLIVHSNEDAMQIYGGDVIVGLSRP